MRETTLIFRVGIMLLALAGCTKSRPEKQAQEAAPKTVLTAPINEMPGEFEQATRRYVEEVLPLLQTGSYVELNALATGLRRSELTLARGISELRCFYEALSPDKNEASQSAWEERREWLEKWVKADSTSIAAHVALARFWTNFAWHARGSSWSHTVTPEGWRLFELRLNKAAEVLEVAGALDEKCPEYYVVWQRVALGQGWPRENYNALFRDAVGFEPLYSDYYVSAVYFLQKRWHGRDDGEWLEFITAEADRIGGPEGDLIYAQAACFVWWIATYDSFLRDSGVSWPRLKNGLELCLARHPESLWAKSMLCYFCGQQGDRERCKQLFESIGFNLDITVWNQERFLGDRAWAFRK